MNYKSVVNKIIKPKIHLKKEVYQDVQEKLESYYLDNNGVHYRWLYSIVYKVRYEDFEIISDHRGHYYGEEIIKYIHVNVNDYWLLKNGIKHQTISQAKINWLNMIVDQISF